MKNLSIKFKKSTLIKTKIKFCIIWLAVKFILTPIAH